MSHGFLPLTFAGLAVLAAWAVIGLTVMRQRAVQRRRDRWLQGHDRPYR